LTRAWEMGRDDAAEVIEAWLANANHDHTENQVTRMQRTWAMDKDKIRLMNMRKQLWSKVRDGAPTLTLLAMMNEINNLTDKIMGEKDE